MTRRGARSASTEGPGAISAADAEDPRAAIRSCWRADTRMVLALAGAHSHIGPSIAGNRSIETSCGYPVGLCRAAGRATGEDAVTSGRPGLPPNAIQPATVTNTARI